MYTTNKGKDICINWKDARLDYTANGKKFHCIMDHISYGETEPVWEDTVDLNIACKVSDFGQN